MTPTNKSFPYPVLGNSDDYNFVFLQNVVGRFANTDTEIVVSCELDKPNGDITDLIQMGKARYVCEITCSKTFYRKSFYFDKPTFDLAIPREEVCDIVYLRSYIVVVEPVKGYTSTDFNEDYDGFTFDFTRGDILAAYKPFKIDTEINYNSLYASDFMQIGRTDLPIVDFSLSENIIYVNLPENIRQVYLNNKSNRLFQTYFLNSVILPALIFALSNFSQFKDKVWARTIDYRIRKGDLKEFFKPTYKDDDEVQPFDMVDIPAIAQKIFASPYQKMFIDEPLFELE